MITFLIVLGVLNVIALVLNCVLFLIEKREERKFEKLKGPIVGAIGIDFRDEDGPYTMLMFYEGYGPEMLANREQVLLDVGAIGMDSQ